MNLSDIPQCPVLYPTLKEFDRFREYMEGLDQLYKKNYGMVKVRPFLYTNTLNVLLQLEHKVLISLLFTI